jgi:molybdopterin/thiamine biosynthesis adenylyltransferase
MFERQELMRYKKQVFMPEIGYEGQQKLKKARVLVVGAGGLGCPVLQYLGAAGVGEIAVADHDVVEESNLHRQILFTMADIGRNKAEVAAERLTALNPFITITPVPQKVTEENAAPLIGAYDFVIDGSDNFATRYLVNDHCVALGKTLVYGSIFQFEGQVSVLNYEGGPNYRSLFPEPPPPEDVPNCAENGVMGPLPGMIGSLMASEALKLICGFGELLSGRLLTFNVLTGASAVYRY